MPIAGQQFLAGVVLDARARRDAAKEFTDLLGPVLGNGQRLISGDGDSQIADSARAASVPSAPITGYRLSLLSHVTARRGP
jgi:hypothetical protein